MSSTIVAQERRLPGVPRLSVTGEEPPEMSPDSTRTDLESIEIDLLLEGVYRHYGVDFRQYARSSLRRRLRKRMDAERCENFTELLAKLLHDPSRMELLLLDLSINVTQMFRDPTFYAVLREKVVPILQTYPFVRLWCAGCSTGEEVYSIAIVLKEEGLLERSRIYATDINARALETARAGVYSLDKMRQYTENYVQSGGTHPFSDYYVARYGNARFDRDLAQGVVFAQHNLVSDNSFNDFHLIVCRNVLIYFDEQLQSRVHGLFHESLVRRGLLALGHKESIRFTSHEEDYEVFDDAERIYRRRS